MGIHVALNHRTSYRYDRPVSLGPQTVRLRPAPHSRTTILSYSQRITPAEHFINWQQDPFGNYMARLVFPEPTRAFEVEIDLIADMEAINPFDFFLEEEAFHVPFTYEAGLAKDLAPYLEVTERGRRLEEFVASIPRTRQRTVDFLVDLNQRVEREIDYVIRMEPGVQTPEQTLTLGRGSCRDSGWLLVQALRRLGYAARFVSGYLIQLTADEKALDGPSGPETDFTDLHAWAEVYAPGAGWIGLDATSGLFAGEGHIPLAATPSPRSAAPITGALLGEAKDTLDFAMSVRRVAETPRVTKPYAPDEWAAIDAAGQAVDAKLRAGDVRLTMGGEPTFVALDAPDAEEWNIDAVGPTKRGLADQLIRRLRDRFAPGGLLHYGQGKWYPGEPLPRWAFALYWRADGQELWRDPALVAAEDAPAAAGPAEAERFMAGLCDALEVDRGHAQPVYEDSVEFILRERKLAPNVDPSDNKLENPEERARIAGVFERGLTTPAGYILPVQPQQARASRRRRFHWRSEAWKTRRKALFLIPGDSPAGFRLPLRSLAYLRDGDYPHIFPLDPFAARGALPARRPRMQALQAPGEPPLPELAPIEEPGAGFAPGGAFSGEFAAGPSVRTAITVEPRDGKVCVFLPPVESVDAFVDLVHAVEETADALGQPVHVEGYTPPSDPRMNVIKVTPDPGVIEVNIHPSRSWKEHVAITETLYDEARATRLGASKFQVDGRPTGSGGGAHVVVGGATPADSPFLRRPDLLGSLIRYWQNHPSLSYLFSGLFIGPTSQAPRIDEARHDSLYELSIALEQIPDPLAASGTEAPPWLVDRLFRHLLVDVTGNTHRSEICIDKLYSPDGPAGRLGLVEFRGFEMPPHPQMNLAQQLVVRALIARFWERPYTAPFIPFGTRLHDQFLLPHFIWRDFETVLAETSEALGATLSPDWFAPQLEFRFPRYGAVRYAGIEVELRAALEPWHVLGEEGAPGGTARFVDSSLERLQVRVTGELADRYAVTCNSVTLPLQPTERGDQHVAGVRFRTWWPASCLQPTIPPHNPLIFDVVDLANGRSVGGCTYSTVHPGGRNFETRPVNELEAQGRRSARFAEFGHTPGPFRPVTPRPNPAFPHTLDLRRV